MEKSLAEIIKAENERLESTNFDLWDYSQRATAYAKWLDQFYKELIYVRSTYLEKNN